MKDWVKARLVGKENSFTAIQENGFADEFSQRILPFLLWLESYYLLIIRNNLVNTKLVEWQQWSRDFRVENLLDVSMAGQ